MVNASFFLCSVSLTESLVTESFFLMFVGYDRIIFSYVRFGMDLVGKRVLVTGGAVRIGRAICEKLAGCGCVVVVHYRNSESEAEALVEDICSKDGRAFAVGGELGGEDSCQRLVKAAAEAAGGLDMLVNNASVFHKDSFMDVTEAKLRDEIEVNGFVPIFLSQAFARLERDAGRPLPYGRIVNLLDRRVDGFEKGALPYILSKKMLADFTKLAALELAPEFTVNAVAPGPVLPPPGKGDDYVKEMAGAMPLRCRLTPADVADAVAYLLGADAVTGQTIYVDGGQRLFLGER